MCPAIHSVSLEKDEVGKGMNQLCCPTPTRDLEVTCMCGAIAEPIHDDVYGCPNCGTIFSMNISAYNFFPDIPPARDERSTRLIELRNMVGCIGVFVVVLSCFITHFMSVMSEAAK
jgi:hypothetical protein